MAVKSHHRLRRIRFLQTSQHGVYTVVSILYHLSSFSIKRELPKLVLRGVAGRFLITCATYRTHALSSSSTTTWPILYKTCLLIGGFTSAVAKYRGIVRGHNVRRDIVRLPVEYCINRQTSNHRGNRPGRQMSEV